MSIFMCIMQENFLNCPSVLKVSSSTCNEIFEFAKNPSNCLENFGADGKYPRMDFYFQEPKKSKSSKENRLKYDL